MKDYRIYPDVLTDSLEELEEKVIQARSFSKVLHVDVIDGLYADNLTIGATQLREIDWGGLKVDVHLLTNDPEDYLGDLHMAKISRAIAQIERMHNVPAYIERCEEYGLQAGLGLDLYTPVEAVRKYYAKASIILLMSVKAGFSGQKFEDITGKIKQLRSTGFNGDVVVDGGLDLSSIALCKRAGANQFAVNSSLWQAKWVAKMYTQFEKSLED